MRKNKTVEVLETIIEELKAQREKTDVPCYKKMCQKNISIIRKHIRKLQKEDNIREYGFPKSEYSKVIEWFKSEGLLHTDIETCKEEDFVRYVTRYLDKNMKMSLHYVIIDNDMERAEACLVENYRTIKSFESLKEHLAKRIRHYESIKNGDHLLEQYKKGSLSFKDISELHISFLFPEYRYNNIFSRSGVSTIGDLKGKSKEDFLSLRGVGNKTVDKIVKVSKEYKIEIK